MPNEAVQCPNCGAGDVQQLGADSYECGHCQTNFRWVNPTTSTVVHQSRVCKCGRVAVALCCRCGLGLCQKHAGLARISDSSDDQANYEYFRIKYFRIMVIPGDGRSSPYMECMVKHRIPEDREAVVCTQCAGECYRALKAIEEQLSLAAAHAATEEAPPPLSATPSTKTTSRKSSLIGRLWDRLRGGGK